MTRKILLSLSITACSFLTINAQKLAVTKGQKLQTVTTGKVNINIEAMSQNVAVETTGTADVEVKAVTDTGFIFSNTIRRIVLNTNAMGQTMSFDSEKKEDLDGPLGAGLKETIGSVQEITVGKEGKIKTITGNIMEDGSRMGDMMIVGQLAEGQPYPLLIQLPGDTKKALKKGETWTDSAGTEAFKSIFIYTLKELTANEAILSFTGTINSVNKLQMQGMEIDMKLTGTSTGDATYDKATGLLKKQNAIMDMKGDMGVMGQTVPMTMTATTTLVVNKQ